MATNSSPSHVLITGGCGFIGSHLVRFLLNERPELLVTNLDALTYAGDKENLLDVESLERYRFVHGDIRDAHCVEPLVEEADWVVNLAAESSVDRSLRGDAASFIATNVHGSAVVLDCVGRSEGTRLLQVSTDEVYGSVAPRQRASEADALRPSSPYAASKAAADLLIVAAVKSRGLDARIARSTNCFGTHQHREKLIPRFVTRAARGEELPLYDDGSQVREWLAVEDLCRALLLLLENGREGEIYNVGSGQSPEITNYELTLEILRRTGASRDLIQRQDGARPGHDQRYAVDSSKLRALGWRPRCDFEISLEKAIQWYIASAGS